jgi:PilZ domain-containing protein
LPSSETNGVAAKKAAVYASRLCARRTLDVRVQLLARGAGDRAIARVYARTVDLSPTGVGLTLSRELPAGSEVLLYLKLPGSSAALCLAAEVVRRRGFRAGLQFVRPTAEQRLRLGEFCC